MQSTSGIRGPVCANQVTHNCKGISPLRYLVVVSGPVCRWGSVTVVYLISEVPNYTLGSPIRIPNYKNLGVDLAPEELRICPWAVGTRKKSGFSPAIMSKSLKKSRCARPDDQLHDRYRDFAMCDEKSEDPAKMTHSISDFLRRLRA